MDQNLGIFSILLVCMSSTWGRDTKPLRSMPAISNSLVNLGKMDISFHFNSKGPDGNSGTQKTDITHSASPFLVSKPEPQLEIEPCPCSSIKNFKNPFLNNPSEIINKVLRSNDLFSVNQESTISTMCCDSHEHVEDTVLFEFAPKTNVAHVDSSSSIQTFPNPIQSALPSFPLILDSILPKGPFPSGSKKAIEIFFFPKSKDGKFDFSKIPTFNKKTKKADIQFVGDKELKNDFKSLKYRPTFPIMLKKEHDKETEKKNEKQQEKERLEKKENEEIKKEEMKKEEAKDADSKESEVESTTPVSSTMSAPNAL